MTPLDQLALLARYNRWMNAKLYDAAATLTPDDLRADRKAFFGSILGTLNHILVADTVWLKRFCAHPANFVALAPMRDVPAPQALSQTLHDALPPLRARRQEVDEMIVAWVDALTEADLDHVLDYGNMRGEPQRKRFGSLALHFFNHQTHHRGQATTLLFQQGVDVGVTDLLALVPMEPAS